MNFSPVTEKLAETTFTQMSAVYNSTSCPAETTDNILSVIGMFLQHSKENIDQLPKHPIVDCFESREMAFIQNMGKIAPWRPGKNITSGINYFHNIQREFYEAQDWSWFALTRKQLLEMNRGEMRQWNFRYENLRMTRIMKEF